MAPTFPIAAKGTAFADARHSRVMRLVFVNNSHPEVRHVSGMRLFYFARAMTQLGHEVVILTGAPLTGRANAATMVRADSFSTHDWSTPMIVEVAPQKLHALEAIRHRGVPILLRRALTAWYFLMRGGVFADWTRAAKPVAVRLLKEFRPDLVWATFGNTSNLTLAQWIAKRANCPWILDVKDNWSTFVPAGLRCLMAYRFRDASGMTSNSEHHRSIAAKWIRVAKSKVIYSGVANAFYAAINEPLALSDKRYLLLVGSTYSDQTLRIFLTTFKNWVDAEKPESRCRTTLRYVGSDYERVAAVANSLGLASLVQVQHYVDLEVLAQLGRNAYASCYLWAPFTFHHKLLELLVLGRPVIAFPGEHPESNTLASQCDTDFLVCKSEEALLAAFSKVCSAGTPRESRGFNAAAWRWIQFAETLETFFSDITQAPPSARSNKANSATLHATR